MLIKKIIYLSVFALPCLFNYSHAQVISTVAGNHTNGFSGDNSAATVAQLSRPFGITCDNAGNLYIADRDNNRVRKVSTAGIITTIAGNGTAGYSGDNGSAIQAQLNDPIDVAVNSATGDVYISDKENNRVRMVNIAGVITTVAGTGATGYSGDGGPATAAQINKARGIALDNAGNLYIADQVNHVIRKVATDQSISTIAGTGTAGFSGDNATANAAQLHSPSDVFIDNNGQMYIADVENQRIRKIALNGIITTVAGTGTMGFSGDGGPATVADINEALTMVTDNFGNVYLPDGYNYRVRRIDPSGTISTIAGTGISGYSGDGGDPKLAMLNHPYGLAITSTGDLFVAEHDNYVVRRISNPTGINSATMNGTGIVIFPNPSNGEITIANRNGDKASLSILNMLGQVVINLELTDYTTTLSLRLPKGNYICNISSRKEQISTMLQLQ